MGSGIMERELLAVVDAAFAVTGRGLARWPDPHPDRSPRAQEYSRLTNPCRWRILGARADAWLDAFADTDLARVERDITVKWRIAPATTLTRVDRATPHAPGAISLLLARSRLGDVTDGGVTLGAGDPPVSVTFFPDCGCDACDSGSQDELDHLDAFVRGIVTGTFRRLWTIGREITVVGSDIRRASGTGARGIDFDLDEILAEPRGWNEITGSSWLTGT